MLLSLAAVRGLHLAALVGVFGMLAYRVAFLPMLVRADAAGGVAMARVLDAWTWRALVLAVASALAWLPLQAAQTAGAADWPAMQAAAPVLALHTAFGHAWCARLLLLMGIAVLSWRRVRGSTTVSTKVGIPAAVALALCTVALLLQVEMGHAAAADERWIPFTHGIHVLAAASWLGALLPLWFTVRLVTAAGAALALRRFSSIGSVAVGALSVSAFMLAWEWSGGWVGLVSTDYGRLLLAKLALLLALLSLAALHRWRLVPALATSRPVDLSAAHGQTKPDQDTARASVRTALVVSLGIEILLGLTTLALAAGLATQPPGVHDLAVWPFAWRPDPAVLADEGYVRRLSQTALMVLTAGALLIVAVLSRRLRVWAIAGSLCLVAAVPLPPPSALLIPAYPSSFQHAPTGFDSESIVLGQQGFAKHCASCHGADASGRGPRAASLPMWPPDLAGHMLWDRTDGEVFWRIGHGLRNAAGTQTMSGFADVLSDDDTWALVNFLFANAAGTSARTRGGWMQPLRAPALQLQCGDDTMVSLDALRGQIVHLVALDPPSPAAFANLGLQDDGLATTVVLPRDPSSLVPVGSHVCVATDAAAWTAYARVAGLSPETLAGAQILIDREGWLRARSQPADTHGWTLPDAPAPRPPAAAQTQTQTQARPQTQASILPPVDDRAQIDSLIRRIDATPVDDRRAGHTH